MMSLPATVVSQIGLQLLFLKLIHPSTNPNKEILYSLKDTFAEISKDLALMLQLY